ncbi:NADPH-dependent FMN reductase [Olivibacter sp. XZL3]|uniref:NADPH-dependent FMN reductase n=1 Tax=Olivibacter sp. XZL3 TaxID=1735116 RepID=UPI00106528A3|nr:NAD(P)H-dependent oxidoreductase [Olivibacter sp. XZL3]
MIQLKIILGSTREGRKGPAVANWVFEVAKKYTAFETELIDLKQVNLPFMDEPVHPRMQQYTHQHTKDWSAKISAADAFIFVTPEYNHGMPAPLKNALDFLFKEWAYKPVAMVGYGGVAGGTRAIQQLKQVTNTLQMFAFDGLLLANFTKQLNEGGGFAATEANEKAAEAMFVQLQKLHETLKEFRQ